MSIMQMGSGIINISIALVLALAIMVRSALSMIMKNRLFTFRPFFILGMGLCLTAGFMFYDFFGIAVDVFYIFSFVSVMAMFFIIWRETK